MTHNEFMIAQTSIAGWLPIDTAPTRVNVLACHKDLGVFIATNEEADDPDFGEEDELHWFAIRCSEDTGRRLDEPPTYWQPLPSLPF